jgi:hypothetical protein
MNDKNDNRCTYCGGPLDPIASIGALQTFRCGRCGLERQGLVAFVEPDRIKEEDIPWVNLVVHWHNVPPRATEIACLRRHFPEFASIPLREFMAKVGDSTSFVLGSFLKIHAEALIEQLSGSGLDLRIEM